MTTESIQLAGAGGIAQEANDPRPRWADVPLPQRIARVCALRHVLADDPKPFLEAIRLPFRTGVEDTLAAEIIPLADACKFLQRNAARLLRPRRLGWRGRPIWLWGVESEIRREPLGVVLIICPGNYPLMLPAIQAIAALVAGNRVLMKPAPGASAIIQLFAQTMHRLGVPSGDCRVLDESPDAIQPWLDKIDKVFLTGASDTGRAVARDLASHLVPAVMELSGCDSVIVLPDADLNLTSRCLAFGLQLNGSNSCIAPRRVFVPDSMADELLTKTVEQCRALPPVAISGRARRAIVELAEAAIEDGATLAFPPFPVNHEKGRAEFSSTLAGDIGAVIFDRCRASSKLLQSDIAAPLLSFVRTRSADEAVRATNDCRYGLGASIFGPPAAAGEIARRLRVGSVCINDLIAPTADPRLPFGGRAESGFGVTRGAEGLLEMTRVKTISLHRRGPRLHLLPRNAHTAALLTAQLTAAHGKTFSQRAGAALGLIRAGRRHHAAARKELPR